MAVKLVVLKYEDDATHSLDCTLCDAEKGDAQAQFTTLVFWDMVTGNSFNLCAEHLDMVVTAALTRAKEAHKKGEGSFWYLNEDADPWKEVDS